MKFWEALKALEEGKWVSRKHFDRFKPIRNLSEMAFFLADCCVDEMVNRLNAEWELYEEPKRTYSFMEVVQGLKEGKMFRRRYMQGFLRKETLHFASFKIEDFEATDWEEVE